MIGDLSCHPRGALRFTVKGSARGGVVNYVKETAVGLLYVKREIVIRKLRTLGHCSFKLAVCVKRNLCARIGYPLVECENYGALAESDIAVFVL